MRPLLFLVFAFAATAMAQAVPPPKQFTDAELEAIFACVLALPPTCPQG